MRMLPTPTVVRKTLGSTFLLVALVVAALTAPPVAAQPTLDSAGAQAEPAAEPTPAQYWLRVTAERVNVRSRAALNSRIIGRVNRDDVLEGRGSADGWHQVVPPAGGV